MKVFGTDGIRGTVRKSSLIRTAFSVSQALSHLAVSRNPDAKILVARDPRDTGELLTRAVTAALASYGADAVDLGVLPTPALARLCARYEADYGVMISASHNPPEYNGVKIFNSEGRKLSTAEEESLEALTETLPPPGRLGRFSALPGAAEDYADELRGLIKVPLSGLRIALDLSNGAALRTAPLVLGGKGARLFLTGNDPDGRKINCECGATFPSSIVRAVKENRCDFGFAFDGDGDRVLFCDAEGQTYGGDALLFLFAAFLKPQGRLRRDTVAGTVLTNLGCEEALKAIGVRLIRTDVGDKFLMEAMLKCDLNLGGEDSGHLLLRDYAQTGDGLLSAVMTLNVLLDGTASLAERLSGYEEYPVRSVNVTVAEEQKQALFLHPAVQKEAAALQEELKGCGRIVLRPSGTEPKIRVMCECREDLLADTSAARMQQVLLEVLEKL